MDYAMDEVYKGKSIKDAVESLRENELVDDAVKDHIKRFV